MINFIDRLQGGLKIYLWVYFDYRSGWSLSFAYHREGKSINTLLTEVTGGYALLLQ